MKKNVITKEYSLHDIDRDIVRRYMCINNDDKSINNLIEDCISESLSSFRYSICYTISDVSIEKESVCFDHFNVNSVFLSKNLNGLNSVIIFAATIGIGIDRLINKYSRISPAKALCMQAIGADRIEALCNKFNDEIKKQFRYTQTRFSPGYGDFDISYQKNIFDILDCSKKIGLTLNSSLIMSPSKSVTAVIGFKREE